MIFHQPELRPFENDFLVKAMIPVRSQWGRSEAVVIYSEIDIHETTRKLIGVTLSTTLSQKNTFDW